jgi:secreted Zn-dependent insulinase-like peptidase
LKKPITPMSAPILSPTDDRKYKYITLPNKIECILISDETADKSAAAVSVNVGAISDPEGRFGLAHFLEHMLFLGTEKYPVQNEYSSYISAHGGMRNAFTALQETNYFFDIAPASLEGALDRFS